MFKPTKTNIILALCVSGVLLAFTSYNRHAALPTMPVAAFYVASARFFLMRRKVCKKK